MRKLKKAVAALLAAAMLFGSMPATAFAASDELDDTELDALIAGAEDDEDEDLYDDESDEGETALISLASVSTEDTGVMLADGETYSGACGDNLTWTLMDGVLTISGDASMANYDNDDNLPPWSQYKNLINKVIIEEGITQVGSYAFYDFDNLEDMELPSTLTFIGDYAFAACNSLESIDLPDNMTSLGGSFVLYSCSNLQDVDLPENLTYLSYSTFSNSGITSIVLPGKLTSIAYGAFWGCSSLSSIKFTGELPSFTRECFLGVTATAYYPHTWTSAPSSTAGNATDITWVAYDPDTGKAEDGTILDLDTDKGDSGDTDTCAHTNTTLKGYVAATETETGYTGDTVCDDCGETLYTGLVSPATSVPAKIQLKIKNSDDYDGDGNHKYVLIADITPKNISFFEPGITTVTLDLGDEITTTGEMDFVLDDGEMTYSTTWEITWELHVPVKENNANYTVKVSVTNEDFDGGITCKAQDTFSVPGVGAQDYYFTFGEDNYQFGNWSRIPYYVTNEDLAAFLNELNKDEIDLIATKFADYDVSASMEQRKDALIQNKLKISNGSCYGMMVTAGLFKVGGLNLEDFGYQKTYDIPFDDSIESFINVYQFSQYTNAIIDNFVKEEVGNDDFAEHVDEMWRMASKIEQDSSQQQPYIVTLDAQKVAEDEESKNGGHAVLCIGAENVDLIIDGIAYNRALRIYDPSFGGQSESFIYISENSDSFKMSADYESYHYYFNKIGYLAQFDTYNYWDSLANYKNRKIKIFIPKAMTCTISGDGDDEMVVKITNGTVTGGNLKVEEYYPLDTDGDTTTQEPLLIMKEDASSYTITPSDGEAINATVYFNGIALEFIGNASSATFNDDGTVTVEDAEGDIEISAAVNDGNLSFASVTGEANGDVTVQFKSNSISVSGDITNAAAANSDIEGNYSELELDEPGKAYADVNGMFSTEGSDDDDDDDDDTTTTSSGGGGGGAGAGLAIVGVGAVLVGAAVAAKLKADKATAALPDSSLTHVTENGTEKAFEAKVWGKKLTISTEGSSAVLTGSRSYIEQLSAQGVEQITLEVNTGEKKLGMFPVTKKTTVNVSDLLNNTPQGENFHVELN